ncbi:hypothetical protein A2335_01030 [Candidatus Peregrinibacteria bacterium RIFOXYB2_FULL_32_7]|nr:MAG: hypothetical protein A2335_01030 [Candidatus Peregrinibacteria bacterium RIFOXYB2_FULL_32_7]
MRIVIIGAGAAGLMTASVICEHNPKTEIFLIEKNDQVGKKILLTGGGRCNLTTGLTDIDEILKKYPRGSRFLSYAMHEFPPKKICEFFENHGLPLKIEKDLRVFPKSEKAQDVINVFQKILYSPNVKILLETKVLQVIKKREKFEICLDDNEKIIADKIVLTCGGESLNSNINGYDIAKSFGHSIKQLRPSLTSFIVKEKFIKNLAGIAFETVSLTIKAKRDFTFSGSILFTHQGLSGPAIFAISALVAYEEFCLKNPLILLIDLRPEISFEALLEFFKQKSISDDKKKFVNILSALLPKNLAMILGDNLKINLEKKFNEISKKELNQIVENIKNFKLTLIGRNLESQMVTAGGVNLREIDKQTMQSKICSDLYFAGEILDIDGFTGGFNLQAAWATGMTVGRSIK